jgi:hypothetical protein
MTPSQLVEANVALQKLHSECNDLVLVERSECIENILGHLDTAERRQVLEYARDLAMRIKTTEIRDLKEYLERAGIGIDGAYIETQLTNCRALHAKLQGATAAIGQAYGTPIWGGGGGGSGAGSITLAGGGGDVVNIMDAKKH